MRGLNRYADYITRPSASSTSSAVVQERRRSLRDDQLNGGCVIPHAVDPPQLFIATVDRDRIQALGVAGSRAQRGIAPCRGTMARTGANGSKLTVLDVDPRPAMRTSSAMRRRCLMN